MTGYMPTKNDSNIFLDNLGKIFLVAVAGIVGGVIRSSKSTTNRNKIRDVIEETSAIDPVEIDDLRIANSELQPEVFLKIREDLLEVYPQNSCSYRDFVLSTRSSMASLKGEAFTIQLGHLLDRVATEVLDKNSKTPNDHLPLAFWLTTLSLALSSSVEKRIELLYSSLKCLSVDGTVSISDVEDFVGYLQATCQLPSDTQAIPTENKFPAQQWTRGTSKELVPWEGLGREEVDYEAFSSILRSKSVCAWGECYHKKKM